MRFPRRPIVLAALAAAMLAFPLGVFASHSFTDVPADNMYHADIDALVKSGVTTGCGSGNYCPDKYVTREQMAAFLNRLGALAPNKTPVVNADKVDGIDANGLIRTAHSVTAFQDPIPQAPADVLVSEFSIHAPSAGYVVVNATAVVVQGACTQSCIAYGHIKHVESGLVSQPSATVVPGFGPGSLAWTTSFHVNEGENHFEMRLQRWQISDGQQWHATNAEMTAIFSPFEDNGVGG